MDESPGKMYALATVLMTIPLVAVPLRFYVRRSRKINLSWDDWLILPALLFTILTGICIILGTALGDLGRHTSVVDGRPILTDRTSIFQRVTYFTLLTQTLTFGLTKLSVLFFYKRIFRGQVFNVVIWTAIVIALLWTIAFLFANMFQCVPIWLNWVGIGETPENCIDEISMYIGQAYSDVFTDGILCIPMPWLWNLRIPTARKFAVSGIFLLGTLVVVAGIAKLIVFHAIAWEFDQGDMDLTYFLTPTQYWPMVESSLGILGACLPVCSPLFKEVSVESIIASLRSMISLQSLGSHRSRKSGYAYENKDAALQGSEAKIVINTGSGVQVNQQLGVENPMHESYAEHISLEELPTGHEGTPEGVIVVNQRFGSYGMPTA